VWRVLAGLVLAALWGIAPAEPLTRLPAPVTKLLQRYKLSADGLSVYVQDVSDTTPLLAVNARVPRNPASVMKLLTTLVALQELGPAYTFTTDVYVDVEPVDGVVRGNLYIKGGGDPFLVTESFWRLLDDVRFAGVRHVTGDLVIDGSYFEVEETDRGEFDGRPYRAYNVVPHAALVNFFVTRFRFRPDTAAGKVIAEADPPMSTLALDNRIRLTDARCSWRTRKVRLHVERMGPLPAVRFSGRYPRSCGEFALLRAVAEPVPYLFGVFAPMWERMGGRLDGMGREGLVPESALRVHRARSRPLAELVRVMNKHSNNVMSRNLLLALGAEAYGAPGTVEKGRRAIADWLLLNDIPAPELNVDNGSGLSRKGRISALTLARVLLRGWETPFMPEFATSLPVSALDGTLRKRLQDSDAEGRARMKTGLLNDVRSMAGFVKTRSGRWLAVVSLQNHPGIQHGTGTALQDALLEWLVER
jgi:D-alanyl-D-alanine carboxypeptidase/D-alanyl-D-alanine-endopeptidase (penicillin-binding protein 4)